jgi:hypothetical protein
MVPADFLVFGLSAQDADVLKTGLPGVEVRTPAVIEAVVI